MFKNVLAGTLLTLVMALAVCCPVTEAASYDFRHNQYQNYFEVTMGKSAQNVSLWILIPGSRIGSISVLLRDEKDRYVWQGSYAYTGPSKKINLYLGNDHKKYRIYIKTTGGSAKKGSSTGTVNSNRGVTRYSSRKF